MQLNATPKRINLRFTADGGNASSELCIDCSPSLLTSGALEIGNRHVFANRASRPIFGGRKPCKLLVNVKLKSLLTPESIGKLALSDSKIGELTFVPPFKEDWKWRFDPAVLAANVFVNDELFDRLVTALQSGKKAKWLELEIEKRGVLEYGWEPDGSRRVWKLESPTEPSCVDVVSMYLGIDF